MTTAAIHRVVEQQAVTRADIAAVCEVDRRCSYRELNASANALARRLMDRGLRRGAHAVVNLPRGIDLAVTLLGVLKAGASYTWVDVNDRPELPRGVSFTIGGPADERWLHVAIEPQLISSLPPSPNLPVVTRGTDTACLLPRDEGTSVVVPHATITALRASSPAQPVHWIGDEGAFDLWAALMAGATAIVADSVAAAA